MSLNNTKNQLEYTLLLVQMNHSTKCERFSVIEVDGKKVKNIEEFADILENKSGGVLIEGIYEDLPGEYYYAFGL